MNYLLIAITICIYIVFYYELKRKTGFRYSLTYSYKIKL